jgi:hypothetical protein
LLSKVTSHTGVSLGLPTSAKRRVRMLPQVVLQSGVGAAQAWAVPLGLIGGQPLMPQLQQARTEEERDRRAQ